MSPFEFLQAWYQAQTNGEWEHVRGVTIETLDNPGWMVKIDLAGTPLEDRSMTEIREERAAQDWLVCTVEENQFRGQGDAQKLPAILEVFQNWATTIAPQS
jgi:hypothetical protein